MMGVNYDLFWTLNPKSLSPFIKAFVLKQKYDNHIAWTQGLYIRMAIASCLSNTAEYPKEPLGSSSDNREKLSSQEIIKRKMLERMIVINSRFRGDEIIE